MGAGLGPGSEQPGAEKALGLGIPIWSLGLLTPTRPHLVMRAASGAPSGALAEQVHLVSVDPGSIHYSVCAEDSS